MKAFFFFFCLKSLSLSLINNLYIANLLTVIAEYINQENDLIKALINKSASPLNLNSVENLQASNNKRSFEVKIFLLKKNLKWVNCEQI